MKETGSTQESEERLRLATQGAGLGTWRWDFDTNRVIWSEKECELVGIEPPKLDTAAEAFFSRIHPDDLPRLRLAIDDTIKHNAPYDTEFRVVLSDRSIRWLAGKGEVYRDESGKPVRMIGVNFDITGRKEAELELERVKNQLTKFNESLEHQVQERTAMLSILQDVTRSANEARTVKAAMRTALKRIAEYKGCQLGHAWRLDEAGEAKMMSAGIWYVADLAKFAVDRLDEYQQNCREKRFAMGEGFVGSVWKSGEAKRIDDIERFDDWRRSDVGELGLCAVIAFPAKVHGKVVSVLEFYSDHPIECDDRFMEIMPDVGIQLGHLIERKRLERLIADATEHEQRRIGSDIHDGVGQELTGLKYLAQTHAETLKSNSSPDAEIARRIAEGFRTIQEDLRTVVRHLVPVELDRQGLASALQTLAERTSNGGKLTCTFQCATMPVVEDHSLATHIFRIAQEAVGNAIKHAEASHIVIRLYDVDGELHLHVEDDGVGMKSHSTASRGYGLHTMGFRADLVGGRLQVEPGEVSGTVVHIAVPVRLTK